MLFNMTDNNLPTALEHLMRKRRSCRAFLPDELPQELIERILDTSQRTASWCNTQPWQLTITRAGGTNRLKKALYEAASLGGAQTNGSSDIDFPAAYEGIYLERRRNAAFQLFDAMGIDKNNKAERELNALRNFELFGAPHLVIVSAPSALGTYGAMDCAAWVSNFMLVALSHGVASIAQASLARYSDLLHRHLSIDQNNKIVCGVSIGLADTAHPANNFRTTRATIDNYVKWLNI